MGNRDNGVVAVIIESEGHPTVMRIPIRNSAGAAIACYEITEDDFKGGVAEYRFLNVPPPDFALDDPIPGWYTDAGNVLKAWSRDCLLEGMELVAYHQKPVDSGGERIFACYAYPIMLSVSPTLGAWGDEPTG